MSNKIKILPIEEAQKVAAGEVVERPSNIVKETLENSIDASSTQISLYIENAGKKLIRIQDNGCGMSNDDAKLCFATHATSKIKTLNDLENISSFGFRGEALASISAVSKVTLKTKLKQDESVQLDPSIHLASSALRANGEKKNFKLHETDNDKVNKKLNSDANIISKSNNDNSPFALPCPTKPYAKSWSDSKQSLAENNIKGSYQTDNQNPNLGIKIKYSQNKLISEEQISMSHGTDLIIEDLFYNIPVRKKFLKQDDTEWNQILNIFQAFCLSNINIHFKLFKDGRLIINAPTTQSLQERTSQLWGHNFSQNLIDLIKADPKHYKNKDINFSGLISNHNFWRYGKQQIFFFVNGRYVKDKDLNKALFKGYTGVLPPGRFPAAFLFLNVPNDFVDINVHPKKEEVRFLKPGTVNNYLQRLVKESLDSNVRSAFEVKSESVRQNPFDTPVFAKATPGTQGKREINNNKPVQNNNESVQQDPSIQFANKSLPDFAQGFVEHDRANGKEKNITKNNEHITNDSDRVKIFLRQNKNYTDNSPFALSDSKQAIAENSIEGSNRTNQSTQNILTASDFYNSNQDNIETKLASNILRPRVLEYEKQQKTIYEEKNVDTRKEFKVLGQLDRTYILIESNENLILIDQHDAHERVIYDRITKRFENHEGTKLMFPEIIELSSTEIKQIKHAQEFLKKQGIETEFFGKNQLAIKSSPPKVQNQSLKELIFEILEFIKENEKLDTQTFRKKLNDRVHAQISCKSAVKAGDVLSVQQMQEIVEKLYKTENPLTCPHGRPTTWVIKRFDIEKKFKRDYK
jgi:DNA mismatch repair protein MutL